MQSDSLKRVLVTGANTGIGYGLTKRLLTQHNCYVYLGSRSLEKGNAAIEDLIKEFPECKGKVELVIVDVSNPGSIKDAADVVKAKLAGQKLYGLVNNAGVGGATAPSNDQIIRTNVYGVKLVTEAFLPLVESRIVNVSSGGGPMWVMKEEDAQAKELFSTLKPTWAELEAYFTKKVPTMGTEMFPGVYGLSKAIVNKYTEIIAKENPTLLVSAITPGFIATSMTNGFGAKKTPEEGAQPIIHCLFSDLKESG